MTLKNRRFTDKEIDLIIKNLVVLVDRREKPDKNTHITDWFEYKNRCKYERVTLKQGDYSFRIDPIPELGINHPIWFDRDFTIERKMNLEEISTNLTSKRSQFEHEFSSFKGKMIVVIEDSWSRLFMGTYNTKYNRKSFIASVFTFWQRYDVPFVFLTKEEIPVFIYAQCVYFLKEYLK